MSNGIPILFQAKIPNSHRVVYNFADLLPQFFGKKFHDYRYWVPEGIYYSFYLFSQFYSYGFPIELYNSRCKFAACQANGFTIFCGQRGFTVYRYGRKPCRRRYQ